MGSTLESKELTEKYVLGTYPERQLALVRGQGAHVWDADGNVFIDCLSGIGVNNVGHCHPRVVEAICNQARTLLHVSNLYLIEPQARLAELLCKQTFASRVFFANSGAEAVEGALKLARKYARKRGYAERYGVVSFAHSFHGRTFGAMTATGQEKYHKDFDPLLPGFSYAVLDDLASVEQAVDKHTCAILIEPVQGEGGIRRARKEFLQDLRRLCDEKDLLLIFDEVQCGNGRTGKLYAYEHRGVIPDVLATAKGLGGGIPIGAFLVGEKAKDTFEPGNHATTFGGGPLATAAALAALQAILDEGLCERAEKLGGRLMRRLAKAAERLDRIVEVRGLGLMIGVELKDAAAPVVQAMRARGFLIGTAGPNVVRLLPPLVIEEEDLNALADNLEEVLGGCSI